MHEKCTGTIDNKKKKNKELNQRYVLELSKNKTTIFS